MKGFVLRPITVFLLDDHELVRRGLVDLLDTKRDITVVGEGGSAARTPDHILRVRPDVMVLDVHLRDGSGVEVCRRVRAADPTIKGLLLTADPDDQARLSAVVAGAHGWALKEAQTLDLVDAIRRVGADQQLLTDESRRRVIGLLERLAEPGSRLSRRDLRLLRALLDSMRDLRVGDAVGTLAPELEHEVAGLVPRLAHALLTVQPRVDR